LRSYVDNIFFYGKVVDGKRRKIKLNERRLFMSETKVVLVYSVKNVSRDAYDVIFTKEEQEWFLSAPNHDIKYFNKGDEVYFSYGDMTVSFIVEKKNFDSDNPNHIFIQVSLDFCDMSPEEFREYILDIWSRKVPD
jgi:hypothetical protein